jgi:NADPH:quinone reductase-like Zn-dependent oxidoreductase
MDVASRRSARSPSASRTDAVLPLGHLAVLRGEGLAGKTTVLATVVVATTHYTKQDFSEGLSGYDLVIDSLGGQSLEKSLTVRKPGGLAIGVAGPPDAGFASHAERGGDGSPCGDRSDAGLLQAESCRPPLEHGEVALGVLAVQPFLVDDCAEAAAHREGLGLGIARLEHRLGHRL